MHKVSENRMANRLPLMALAGVSLLAALWAALVRAGWTLPALPVPIAAQHGSLMISGFLGTLISLERAVALAASVKTEKEGRWSYLVPLLSGLGAILLLLGLPKEIGRVLITLAGVGLVLIFIRIYQIHPVEHVVPMIVGALLWLVGSALWLFGASIAYAVPWWAGFLILTIAGERLELARVMMAGKVSRTTFLIASVIFVAGMPISLFAFDFGLRMSGVGLIALGLWALRFDITRRTIRQKGLTRFIASCLMPGYFWLIGGGGLWAVYGGGYTSGVIYDAMLHSVFLGFVMSMIFGHAPIILPAVLSGIEITYRPAFYAHLGLLHLSLILRVTADLTGSPTLRMWGGMFNVIAVLIFLANMARSVRRQEPAPQAAS